MAIDPKELRIGSHYYNGGYVERVIGRITAIYGSVYRPEEMNVGLIYDMPLDEDSDPYEHTMAINLEPIQLTPELLTELGFLKMEEYGAASVWMNRNIRIDIIGERITAMVGNDYNKCTISSIRYLHELELFLYLTTKQRVN